MSNSDSENDIPDIPFKNDDDVTSLKKLTENDDNEVGDDINGVDDDTDDVDSDIDDNDDTDDDKADDEDVEENAQEEADEEEADEEEADNDENNEKKSKMTTNIPTAKFIESEDENDEEYDDDDENEDEYYKFDEETRQTFLEDHHPEAKIHNYEEILLLSKVQRNKEGIIVDDFHQTLPFLTKYERTRILGQRAKQLDDGANAFISVPENVIDGYQIAEMELEEKKIPFIIRRPLPNGNSEYWKIQDLEIF